MDQRFIGIERDFTTLTIKVDKLSEETIPKLQEKFYELSSKLNVSNALWSVNLLFLGFVVYKLFEISGKIK